MSSDQCDRHPGETLRFYCLPCSTPVCRDCKLTHHEGHRTTDIHMVTSDLRLKLAKEKEEVDKCLRAATALRGKLQRSLDSLDQSVERTQSCLDKRVEAVVEWARTSRLSLEGRVRQLKQQARGQMEAAMDSLQQQVTYLTQVTSAMTRGVEGRQGQEVRHQHVAKLYGDYQQHHKGQFPSAKELGQMINVVTTSSAGGGHSLEMSLTGSGPDECQRAIERYLGLPLMSRQMGTLPLPSSSRWSFATRVTPSPSLIPTTSTSTSPSSPQSPSLIVADILPAGDGSVSVLYRYGESSYSSSSSCNTTTLVHYSPDGVKRAERAMEGGGVVMVMTELTGNHFSSSSSSFFSTLGVFSVTSETWQRPEGFPSNLQAGGDPATPDTPEQPPPLPPPAALYLKPGPNGTTNTNTNTISTITAAAAEVCEVTYPLHPGQSSPRPSVLLTLDFTDAVAVTASTTRRHLAVLRKSQGIHVYQRHGGNKTSTATPLATWDVTSQLSGMRVGDLCFGRVRDQEVLMVAESIYSVILFLDHLNGCALTSFIPSPRPRPTCLRADVTTGTLWIGCEGGEVVAGVVVSKEQEDEEEEVLEDPDGYLVPSEDLYLNIRTLRSKPLSTMDDHPSPPHRTARQAMPELPPRKNNTIGGGGSSSSISSSRGSIGSSSVTSAGDDQLGMPLRPPPPPVPPALGTLAPLSCVESSLQSLLHCQPPMETGKGDGLTLQRPRKEPPVSPSSPSPSPSPSSAPSSSSSSRPDVERPQPSSSGPPHPGSYENMEPDDIIPSDGEPGRERQQQQKKKPSQAVPAASSSSSSSSSSGHSGQEQKPQSPSSHGSTCPRHHDYREQWTPYHLMGPPPTNLRKPNDDDGGGQKPAVSQLPPNQGDRKIPPPRRKNKVQAKSAESGT